MVRFVIFGNLVWYPRGHDETWSGAWSSVYGPVIYVVLPPGSTAADARDAVIRTKLWYCATWDCTPSQMWMRFWWEGVFI